MLKKIGAIIVFIACFVAAKYAVELGMEKSQKAEAVAGVEEVFSKIEKESESYDSETPKSIAMQEVAIKMAEENINSQKSPQRKIETAISTFMGFFLVNYRTRSEFCETLGVGISTFTNEFQKTHLNELNLSKKILFKKEGDIDKLYELIKPQSEKVIAQDMSDIASQYNVTEAGACQLIEDNGISFAQTMHISNIQPAVYREMHN